jgi:hypothetical protein
LETSAFRCWLLCELCLSFPRSSRRMRIMLSISLALRRGELQKVQGPKPSLTQMIFPQFKQFGAASRIAWR